MREPCHGVTNREAGHVAGPDLLDNAREITANAGSGRGTPFDSNVPPVGWIYGNGLDSDEEPAILGLGNGDVGDAGCVALAGDDGVARSHGEDVSM